MRFGHLRRRWKQTRFSPGRIWNRAGFTKMPSHDPAVKESLIEALRLNQTYFYPIEPGLCAFYRQFDWKPATGPGRDGLSYGHNVEFAWLMVRTETVLGRRPSWNHFYALLNHALKYGYDDERGGLYSRGFDDHWRPTRKKSGGSRRKCWAH